jgi:hypothetical protein
MGERKNDQVQTNTILNKFIKCGIVAKREVFIKPVKYWPFLKIKN